ncbi:hypothetical protein Tco_0362795, partial [Tanacetum coccineum]
KKSKRKQRKDSGPTEPIPDEATNKEHVATPSCDPPQSGNDRMQLTKLMDLCTQLQSRVLALETTKSNQALEIKSLKRRVKSLEKRRKSRTSGFERLRKVGSASRVESSNNVSLGAQKDASKQGRKIVDLDADAEEIEFEKVVEEPVVSVATTTKLIPVSTADPVTTAGEVVTTASATTTVDQLTQAQTLIEIKAARPKAKGIVFHDQEEQASAFTSAFTPIVSSSQLPQVKDKGKGKMVEPEVPLKKKDQIALDEEPALRLHAEEQVELEKERVAQEEASKAAIIEELDSIQAMINADE